MAKILIIEDNAGSMELMNYLLRNGGHETIAARNGADGIARALAERPQLIVCDIHMPVMDGYEVARRLKADPATRDIPLVAVTALAMMGDRERVLAAGFDDYVTKPIEPEVIAAQLARKLGGGPPAPDPAGTDPAPKTGA